MSKKSYSLLKIISDKSKKLIGITSFNKTEIWAFKKLRKELFYYFKVILIMFGFAFLVHFYCKENLLFLHTNDSTLHYFLSSLIQADAAIISIVIVILIFKRQYLGQETEKIKTIFRFEFSSAGWWFKVRDFDQMPLLVKMVSIESLPDGKEKQLKEQWIDIELKKVESSIHFSFLIIISLFTITVFTILLPFSITLHQEIINEQFWILIIYATQFALMISITRSIFKMFMVI